MLTIARRAATFCDGVTRRGFLRVGGLALGGMSLADVLRLEAEAGQAPQHHKATIMIYLAGGPPHMDMFDMKPLAPSEFRGEFAPIQTSVPGIEICEHFPEVAKRMERFAIIRSLTGMVDRHESNQCFSGWTQPQTAQNGYPSLGSAVQKLSGPVDLSMPPFVSLSFATAHKPWGNPGEPGYLGPAFSPFQPDGPGLENMIRHVPEAVLSNRELLLSGLNRLPNAIDTSGMMEGLDNFQQQALGVLTSSRLLDALDLEKASSEDRERYGYGSRSPVDDGPCADPQDILRALRLVQAGARCVTATFCRWDWHGANFSQGRRYMPMLDKALGALSDDLVNLGLENDVSVVVWGEFGRTPRVNKDAGRDHWPSANCALLTGGGMRTGQVIGATDRNGEKPVERPVSMQSVLATLYCKLGIDPGHVTIADRRGRPQYLVDDRVPIQELI